MIGTIGQTQGITSASRPPSAEAPSGGDPLLRPPLRRHSWYALGRRDGPPSGVTGDGGFAFGTSVRRPEPPPRTTGRAGGARLSRRRGDVRRLGPTFSVTAGRVQWTGGLQARSVADLKGDLALGVTAGPAVAPAGTFSGTSR